MPKIVKIKRAVPLRDQVLNEVIEGLSAGKFRSGERLTEERVATVLGVSRTPVREALSLLAQRGMLTRRAYGGFVVATPSVKILQQVLEVRRLLEPSAARRAAERMSAAELSQLRKALQRLRKVAAKGRDQEVMHAIWGFRRLLYGASGNDVLTKTIEQANDYYQVQFIILLALASAAVRKLMVARLTRICAAVEARDGAAVECAVHKNLDAWYKSTGEALARFESSSCA